MKKALFIIIASLVLLPILAEHCGNCPSATAEAKNTSQTSNATILHPKKSLGLYDNHTVSFQWDKSPNIGNRVLFVNIRDKKNRLSDDFTVTANAYMPSMRGAHDTGDKPLKLNKKNQYAIPVHFMMLGGWEIELKFSKDGKLRNSARIVLDIK